MIGDNELEDRLNAVKNGNNPPDSRNQDEEMAAKLKGNAAINVYKEFGYLIGLILTPILYGYAFNAIFNQDWTFFEIVGVGFLFKQLMKILITGIRKLFLNPTYKI